MPAMLDDPARPTIYRARGLLPDPTAGAVDPSAPSAKHFTTLVTGPEPLPPDVVPRTVTLRDRSTIATLLPFAGPGLVPPRLLAHLADQLNREIEIGDTYPMLEPLSVPAFAAYWFQNFGAIMLLGDIAGSGDASPGGLGVEEPGGSVEAAARQLAAMEASGVDWSRNCLGSFYTKPNYPGRSSHVCNGGFLVTDVARNKGVGRLMGECYLDWAPKLGYTYSVFNLVYDTNVASCRIWDALGFKRIGRVPGCGALRSYPDRLVDAIVYGRELGPEADDEAGAEERFDKIRYYLKTGQYPAGADRAEKSRLRSAATHYKLLPPNPDDPLGPTDGWAEDANGQDTATRDAENGTRDDAPARREPEERLMLKDKEVVADPARQGAIARRAHVQGQHGGINKTTATVAERYHWTRIKDTVALAIRQCQICREGGGAGSGAAKSPADGQRVRGATADQGTGLGNRSRSAPNHNGDNAVEENGLRSTSKLMRNGGAQSDPNGQIERLASFTNILGLPSTGLHKENRPPAPASHLPTPPHALDPTHSTHVSRTSAADTSAAVPSSSFGEDLPVDPQIMELDAPEYRMYFGEDSQAGGAGAADRTMGDEVPSGSGETAKVGSDLTRQFLTTPFETDGADGVGRM